MEKYVDSDYIQHEYDASKTSDTETCGKYHLSNDLQEAKRKAYCKTSRVRKKIASNKEVSRGESNTGNIAGRHFSKTKDVLKTNIEEEETKTIQRNVVPDRLGKQLSSSNVGRSETKSLDVGDLKRKMGSSFGASEGVPISSETPPDERTHTKLPLLGTECLSNKEAVSLRNSFECVSEAQNIFENFFGDCLDSTRKGKDASSHGTCESEEGFRECERTPARKKPETEAPSAPTKDHVQYYASQKTVTRHVCGYCQKIFKSNGKLNSHVYSHTGERPFDCNHCGKAFSSKFKLVRHLLIHSEIRRFVCQICDRTFLRNDHLKNHYKVHDPQKKMYKCPRENCDKEYSSVMSHKKHMAYHSVEDGDLKCFMCNVKFETKEEILFHLKSHSGSRLFKTQSDKKFKCDFCERLFLTRKDVTRHLVVHTGERDFLCQFCPQRFGRKDHLVRHIKKSHGNEEISVKCEGGDGRKQEEGKSKTVLKRCVVKEEGATPEVTEDALSSPQRRLRFPTKENTQAEGRNNKTHIVITVQGKAMKGALENRKRKYSESGNKKKSFQRNESLVPKKKVPLAKGKNSTTQILLQNIPNILIIPNNSIILLRNQTETCGDEKGVEKGEERKTEDPAPCLPEEPERLTKPPPFACGTDGNGNFPSSFPYDASSMFQPASHFLEGFSDSDSFCNFQPDFSSFGSHFEDSEHISFEMLGNADLMTRTETGLGATETDGPSVRSDGPSNGGALLTETSRQIKLLEDGMTGKLEDEKCCGDIGKDLFEDGNESLILNEVSILNDFKDESSSILPADNDIGILNNILNQTSDNCGFEILRNLLTAENPVLSPLPGFNQIFHNSNANSS